MNYCCDGLALLIGKDMAINLIYSIPVAAARGSIKLKPRDRMCSLRHIV